MTSFPVGFQKRNKPCQISTGANGGPHSRVCALDPPLGPHRHQRKFAGHMSDSGGYVKFTPKYIIVRGKMGLAEFLRVQS